MNTQYLSPVDTREPQLIAAIVCNSPTCRAYVNNWLNEPFVSQSSVRRVFRTAEAIIGARKPVAPVVQVASVAAPSFTPQVPFPAPAIPHIVIADPAYWELRRQLRHAEAVRSAVPSLSPVPWSAGAKWSDRERATADAAVRRAKRAIDTYRRTHRLGVVPKFWRPRTGCTLPPRVARFFSVEDTQQFAFAV